MYFYKIDSYLYFTILIFLFGEIEKFSLERINYDTENFIRRGNFCIKVKKLDKDYLYKMIKCCGNVCFNKKEKWYFAKSEEIMPILLFIRFKYFSHQIINYQNINKTKKLLNEQLSIYEHNSEKEKFIVLRNTNEFCYRINNSVKSFIQFLNKFYK